MANVGDIKPAEPLWPRRPTGKVRPGGRRPDRPPGEHRQPDEGEDGQSDDENRDDGHIDEYV